MRGPKGGRRWTLVCGFAALAVVLGCTNRDGGGGQSAVVQTEQTSASANATDSLAVLAESWPITQGNGMPPLPGCAPDGPAHCFLQRMLGWSPEQIFGNANDSWIIFGAAGDSVELFTVAGEELYVHLDGGRQFWKEHWANHNDASWVRARLPVSGVYRFSASPLQGDPGFPYALRVNAPVASADTRPAGTSAILKIVGEYDATAALIPATLSVGLSAKDHPRYAVGVGTYRVLLPRDSAFTFCRLPCKSPHAIVIRPGSEVVENIRTTEDPPGLRSVILPSPASPGWTTLSFDGFAINAPAGAKATEKGDSRARTIIITGKALPADLGMRPYPPSAGIDSMEYQFAIEVTMLPSTASLRAWADSMWDVRQPTTVAGNGAYIIENQSTDCGGDTSVLGRGRRVVSLSFIHCATEREIPNAPAFYARMLDSFRWSR